jgi:hypothetical protein
VLGQVVTANLELEALAAEPAYSVAADGSGAGGQAYQHPESTQASCRCYCLLTDHRHRHAHFKSFFASMLQAPAPPTSPLRGWGAL